MKANPNIQAVWQRQAGNSEGNSAGCGQIVFVNELG